MKESEPEI